MRNLNNIILHCSATKEGAHIDVSTIRRWHKEFGWKDCGYHFVIYLDGSINIGRPIDQVGAHTKGHNKESIGVCYVGGIGLDDKPKDTMNEKQELGLFELIYSIRTMFGWMPLSGHNEYANKACPSFNVPEKYKWINIEGKE